MRRREVELPVHSSDFDPKTDVVFEGNGDNFFFLREKDSPSTNYIDLYRYNKKTKKEELVGENLNPTGKASFK